MNGRFHRFDHQLPAGGAGGGGGIGGALASEQHYNAELQYRQSAGEKLHAARRQADEVRAIATVPMGMPRTAVFSGKVK